MLDGLCEENLGENKKRGTQQGEKLYDGRLLAPPQGENKSCLADWTAVESYL